MIVYCLNHCRIYAMLSEGQEEAQREKEELELALNELYFQQAEEAYHQKAEALRIHASALYSTFTLNGNQSPSCIFAVQFWRNFNPLCAVFVLDRPASYDARPLLLWETI